MRELVEMQSSNNVPTGLPRTKYRVIYVDPPWDYGSAGQSPKIGGGARAHYPTMKLNDICALDVSSIAEPDAVLFLWVTSPMLTKAFRIVNAWGFEYKSSFVWDKVKHNMGHYVSVRHEFVFLCTRGVCDPIRNDFESMVSIPRTVHSKKPAYFREMIDAMYPSGERIELFARGELPEGWTGWGNEYIASGRRNHEYLGGENDEETTVSKRHS